MRHDSPRAIGLIIAGIFFAAWIIAVAALIVPALLVGAVAVRTFGWLARRNGNPPRQPLIIDGEYEVLNSESGKG